jgi:hypothetical protein
MKKEMSETLVRTGPGTRMGNLLRRYWVPILLSREIAEPDGPQVRVQILGEKLLAFRGTDGEPSANSARIAALRSTSAETRRTESAAPIMASNLTA